MKRRHLLLSLALLSPFAAPVLAQAVNNLPGMTTVTFPAGSTSTTLPGQLAPGGRAVYYVLAKAGQTLQVSVMPAASGATFQVFHADATVAQGADGIPVLNGRTLPDAGPSDNAKAWIGAIPRDGNYPILVTMGAGGAAAPSPYNLAVSLQ